jgi:hypothetical protein
MQLTVQIAGQGTRAERSQPLLSRALFGSLACLLRKHQPASGEVWNHGFFFSKCSGCGKQLVRRRCSRWEEVPKGFKVVWRARKGGNIDWTPWRPEVGRAQEPHSTQSASRGPGTPAVGPAAISQSSDEPPTWQEELREAWRRASQRR